MAENVHDADLDYAIALSLVEAEAECFGRARSSGTSVDGEGPARESRDGVTMMDSRAPGNILSLNRLVKTDPRLLNKGKDKETVDDFLAEETARNSTQMVIDLDDYEAEVDLLRERVWDIDGPGSSNSNRNSSSSTPAVDADLLDPCPDILALFCHYNELYFGGLLGACVVEWSSARMTL